MSSLLGEPLIMSVADFRKLTGAETAHLSDEQIAQVINQLDVVAQIYISSIKPGETPMEQTS